MKPKSRQETSEFMAEKVLGWTCIIYQGQTVWIGNDEGKQSHSLIDFIYSPEGFFAVWDAVEKKLQPSQVRGIFMQVLTASNRPEIDMGGKKISKDRYEAFYNAVWEVHKEKSEHS